MQTNWIATVAMALLITGCATTSTADLREQRPVEATYESHRPPAEIAKCLAENLGRLGTPSIYSTDSETTVTFHRAGNTLALFSIAPDGKTTVRRAVPIGTYRKDAERCF